VCGCSTGYSDCGGVCVETAVDNGNCGACGRVCGAGQYCVMGGCITPTNPPPADAGTTCSTGRTSCSGVCCDLQTDNGNCGSCGNVCSGGASCQQGRCVAPPPPADAGAPTPTTDEWRVIYRAAPGDQIVEIQSLEVWDGSARECSLNRLDPEQAGAPLVNSERCPAMRFARGATLHFNARFTFPAPSATAPMTTQTWSCHVATRGGPMQAYGTVEAYRNGQRVQLRAVDNGRQGCNWVPVI